MATKAAASRASEIVFPVVIALVAVIALPAHSTAATFVVDAITDAVDAIPGDGTCATVGTECTLRAAIQEANALPGRDAITLPAGTYTFALVGTDEDGAATGDLDITEDLDLTGDGAGVTIIDADHLDRVLQLFVVDATITGVTVRNGAPPSSDFTGGGGISSAADLVLTDVTVRDNVVDKPATGGGGILAGGVLSMVDGVIADNVATTVSFAGGGLYCAGTCTLTRTLVTGNVAPYGGGAFGNGPLDVIESVVTANVAVGSEGGGSGGGLANVRTVTDSTISANMASSDGGGIDSGGPITVSGSIIRDNVSGRAGGGASVRGWTTIVNTTISGNRAAEHGGGVYDFALGAASSYRNVTIALNVADDDHDGMGNGGGILAIASFQPIRIQNSLIADNTDRGGEAPDCYSQGSLTSLGYNLIRDVALCSIGGDLTGNLTGVDPLLGSLASNGGPTATHALLSGSPAINAASLALPGSGGAACEAIDQRGIARPQGGRCDIGAFEGSCGDGNVDVGEPCDDGGNAPGDGCSPSCTIDPGWSCTGSPSVCTQICGDGIVTVDETCDDGNVMTGDCCSATCQLEAAGSPCADDGNGCRDDHCDGAGVCVHPANSAPCDDDDACTTADTCSGGTCVGGAPPDCARCEICDQGLGCIEQPRPDCARPFMPFRGSLKLKDASPDGADRLVWKWSGGPLYNSSDLGDPRNTSSYALCLFDGAPGLRTRLVAPAGGTCGGKPCWKALGSIGFGYSNKSLIPDGLQKIIAKGGGSAKFIFKGKGLDLPMPALDALVLPVTVQLQVTGGGCWEAVYTSAGVSRSDAQVFQAKDDGP
jgi:cysteine-rich repeat protein